VAKIESDMDAYLSSLNIPPGLVVKTSDRSAGILVYSLDTPEGDFDTLDLKDRPGLDIRDETVQLPGPRGETRNVRTVSRKEIVLALMQRGRLTEFKGSSCSVAALRDHVGIRQNTVALAEDLNWVWPDGEPAEWNEKYWRRGTPREGVSLHEAVNDVFGNQGEYSIGCYTATKLVMIQGVLDYYRRVKKDPARLKYIEDRLLTDGEPLLGIEPGKMRAFEPDFDPAELERPGKILRIQYGVAPRSFVPGDWAYLLNPDPVSSRKTGYEGSSALYLGRNRFADYFNDRSHSYSYRQKLDEVFQWRNGVFNWVRDAAKAEPLTDRDIERLGGNPAEGGIVGDFRVFPYFFGAEKLPDL
jgi:hypothetical protein